MRVNHVIFKSVYPGPRPSVITLHGGVMRGQPVEDVASTLASNGYVTMALAYFGVEVIT